MRARPWFLILAGLIVCAFFRSNHDSAIRTARWMPLLPLDAPEASPPPTEGSSRPCEVATAVDDRETSHAHLELHSGGGITTGASFTLCDEEACEEEIRPLEGEVVLGSPSVFFFEQDGTRYFSQSLREVRTLAGEGGDVFAFVPPEETEAWSPHAHLWVLIHWDLADVYTPGRRRVTNVDFNDPATARISRILEKLRERIRDRYQLGAGGGPQNDEVAGFLGSEDERDPARY